MSGGRTLHAADAADRVPAVRAGRRGDPVQPAATTDSWWAVNEQTHPGRAGFLATNGALLDLRGQPRDVQLFVPAPRRPGRVTIGGREVAWTWNAGPLPGAVIRVHGPAVQGRISLAPPRIRLCRSIRSSGRRPWRGPTHAPAARISSRERSLATLARRTASVVALVVIDLSGLTIGLYFALALRSAIVDPKPILWNLLWDHESDWLPVPDPAARARLLAEPPVRAARGARGRRPDHPLGAPRRCRSRSRSRSGRGSTSPPSASTSRPRSSSRR